MRQPRSGVHETNRQNRGTVLTVLYRGEFFSQWVLFRDPAYRHPDVDITFEAGETAVVVLGVSAAGSINTKSGGPASRSKVMGVLVEVTRSSDTGFALLLCI
jgi:hypothetical protein